LATPKGFKLFLAARPDDAPPVALEVGLAIGGAVVKAEADPAAHALPRNPHSLGQRPCTHDSLRCLRPGTIAGPKIPAGPAWRQPRSKVLYLARSQMRHSWVARPEVLRRACDVPTP